MIIELEPVQTKARPRLSSIVVNDPRFIELSENPTLTRHA